MKKVNPYLLAIIVLSSLFLGGCPKQTYTLAPPQNLPEVQTPQAYSSNVLITNTSDSSLVVDEGVLKGLVLGAYQVYKTNLSWGQHRFCWSQMADYGRTYGSCAQVIITNQSTEIKVYPPRENNRHYRWRGGYLVVFPY